MKTLKTLVVALCLLTSAHISAQIDTSSYDIRFSISSLECETRIVCVETQLRSADGVAWNLAGQNYRLFYDGSKANYVTNSGRSLLETTQYSAFPPDGSFQDIDSFDGSMFGDGLPFSTSLSFLNYSIDLMSLGTGGIDLPASGEWVPTTELCFEVEQALIDDPSNCFELYWARPGVTNRYATAFVEISQWISSNNTESTLTNELDDLTQEDGTSCLATTCNQGTMSETTAAACSDGLDNDMDGLVDCDDPNCANAVICQPDEKQYNISLQLADNGVNCATGMVCYDINLTAVGSSFVLGTQNYRLFYNSTDGEFLSAQSLLGAQFQALSLQNGTPREGRDASGLGSLPYESTLGYLDFTLQLNDAAVGSNVTISTAQSTRVAQVCFTMSANVINNGTECFEADWAREGVTEVYESNLLEIDEWVSETTTEATVPVNFGNINAANGDGACFNISCADTERGAVQCTDGIDNDNDGLIDCQDPGCASLAECDDNCNALAPSLSGN